MMMETTKLMQPVVDANKIAFQTWYQSVSAMQDQAEQMMNYVWNQAPMVPESSKKAFNEWVSLLRKERENMKKTVDQGFDSLEQLLIGKEKKQEEKAEKAKSSTSSSKAASA